MVNNINDGNGSNTNAPPQQHQYYKFFPTTFFPTTIPQTPRARGFVNRNVNPATNLVQNQQQLPAMVPNPLQYRPQRQQLAAPTPTPIGSQISTQAQNSGIPRALIQCNDPKASMEEINAIISTIVGLDGVKLQLQKWIKGLVLCQKRKTLGLKVGPRKTLHMAFLGNPGTGKTMVARLLGKILHKLGVTSTDKVTEVQRTDLVGTYIGQTGPKTRVKIHEARGGILFIDEAYRLMPRDSLRDFGCEALEEIMSAMDGGNIVTIFAGYSEEMERVISANPGFARRVSKFFYFDDYSPRDIALILQSRINTGKEDSFVYGFKLHPDCTVKAIARLIKEHTTEEQLTKMNGGLVDPLLVNTLENMDLRLDLDCIDADTLTTITMKDLEEGLKSLSNSRKTVRSDGNYIIVS